MNKCPITTLDLGEVAKWSRRPTEPGLKRKESQLSAIQAPVVLSRAGGQLP